ncbi:hypothetical protein FRC07_000044 [Ceratobasidium sp. 392]|nr:hypothetical protein FRC07_000044 [Ceratobasidium sp. 392]
MRLLSEVALGLDYIHNSEPVVVHGDLRAANVLVSASGKALLAGFGLNQVIALEEGVEVVSTRLRTAGSLRWIAPELLDHGADSSSVSNLSDVWSFGMLCLETFTQRPPYWDHTDEEVIGKLIRRVLPDRPIRSRVCGDGFSDSLWGLMLRCWGWRCKPRPQMSVVVEEIHELCSGNQHELVKKNNVSPRLRLYAWINVLADDITILPLESIALKLTSR